MSNISYPAKTVAGNGGTDYVEGQSLPAAELQADFDAIANVVNGDLDEDNLAGGTQIPNSKLAEIAQTKVGDYSATAAEAATVSSPGDSAGLASNLATDNSEEIEHLRYRIEALAGYRSGTVYRNNAGSNVGAAWVEPPLRGLNLLRNSGFEVLTGPSGDAPDEWTEVGSLASTAIENPANAATGSEKRSLALTTDATGEGISQAVGGIRADTKYLIAVKYIRTAGTWAFTTTGGLSSGNYQNLSISDSSSTGVQVASMIVQSNASGGDLTFGITDSTGSGDINLVQAWMFELNDDWPNPLPDIPIQVATHENSSNTAFPSGSTGSSWNWQEISDLDLAQYIPAAGYRVIYEARICWHSDATGGPSDIDQHAARIQMDSGGGDSVVDGPVITLAGGSTGVNNMETAQVVTLRHVVENATPGLTYDFSVEVGYYNGGSTYTKLIPSPLLNSLQASSKAWLRVERV